MAPIDILATLTQHVLDSESRGAQGESRWHECVHAVACCKLHRMDRDEQDSVAAVTSSCMTDKFSQSGKTFQSGKVSDHATVDIAQILACNQQSLLALPLWQESLTASVVVRSATANKTVFSTQVVALRVLFTALA